MESIDEPKTGKVYRLVRRDGSSVLVAKFMRYDDGSGKVEADGWHISFELDPTTWRRKWDELQAKGYVELTEALRKGILTPEELPVGWDSPLPLL